MDRICTIIAINYLPQAMALLESTRKIYPEIPFFVLVIDTEIKDIPALASATVLIPSDLDIPPAWLAQMKVYYDKMELATSLKPFLLQTLLTDVISSVTFLDPDILVFSELTEAFQAARNFGIALTPHRLTPSNAPDGGLSEIEFLKYGIFNLGFISVGQGAQTMLSWWGERLRWYCTKFPNDSVFTDQKWMNFIPAFFSHKVIFHPGYNFAPWNIDERPLSLQNDLYFAGEKELVFIHFSQMSGALALGKKTNSWEPQQVMKNDHKHSYELIQAITHDYSKKLVLHRKQVIEFQHSHKSGPKFSYHQKKKMISIAKASNSPDSFRNLQSNNVRKSTQIRSKLACMLEKSSALNGFRDGFVQDLIKFKSLRRNG